MAETFSYSGDPSTSPLDWARFIISDTNPLNPLLLNAEIEFMIQEAQGNQQQLLASLFRQAATALGIQVAKRRLGPQEEDTRDRLNYFKEMAKKYEQGLIYTGIPPLPDYQYDKVFEKGMMANPG